MIARSAQQCAPSLFLDQLCRVCLWLDDGPDIADVLSVCITGYFVFREEIQRRAIVSHQQRICINLDGVQLAFECSGSKAIIYANGIRRPVLGAVTRAGAYARCVLGKSI